jgi:hypothetical protein
MDETDFEVGEVFYAVTSCRTFEEYRRGYEPNYTIFMGIVSSVLTDSLLHCHSRYLYDPMNTPVHECQTFHMAYCFKTEGEAQEFIDKCMELEAEYA